MIRSWSILSALCWLCLTGCSVNDEPSDFDRELTKISDEISVLAAHNNKAAARRQAYLHYARASLTGRFENFKETEQVIEIAFLDHGPSRELYLLRANLDFTLHRLARAEADLKKADEIAAGPQIEILWADIKLQKGQYGQAWSGYRSALERARTWDYLVRLAFLEANTGNPERADRLYDEAGDLLSVKQMRAYAWIELQKGLLDLQYGRYEDAMAHYERANLAYSGYWLVEEHMAEALHLLGRTRESIALYKELIRKTNNPELVGALATILEQTGDAARAAELHRKTETLYEHQLSLYPEARAGHMIVYLLGRPQTNGRLLEYAELNHRIRPNAEAKILLARTYLKAGSPDHARALIDQVLATPWRTPELVELMSAASCRNMPHPEATAPATWAMAMLPLNCSGPHF